ncbi:pyridoxamine 5'-phosphate oxidase family protein [Candidatus Kaiserbacteria bacterium]|nr:pyridoxamine 5'-phosphate oxidase family protein [Candidatus Kaiserbacteria bacterium]
MKISPKISDIVRTAKAKALATVGDDGVNVVPVSTIKVNDSSIWLFDFFMKKTTENIKENKSVGLACWTDLTGVQIKAEVEYVNEGELFTEATAWVKNECPDRVVKGLLILTPTQICDISPGGVFCSEDLELKN